MDDLKKFCEIPLVTFLIPSRKRLGMLQKCLESLQNTAKSISSFEAIIIFDEDDIKTINGFNASNFDFQIKVIVSKRYGYYGLHNYINNSFSEISGQWIWLWNDDLRMIGKDWDEVITEYKDQFVVLNPSNLDPYWGKYCIDATISPLIPRKWFELLGRFSAYSQYDTYINSIAYPLNIVINESRLVNIHNQVQDEVSAGIVYDKSIFPADDIQKDYLILRQHIGLQLLIYNWARSFPYRFGRYMRRRKKHFERMLSYSYLKKKFTKYLLK